MAFCDSHLFEINDQGIPLHKREGESYADKTINGVSLDDTIMWDNEMVEAEWWTRVVCDYQPPLMVGERSASKEIQETTTSPGKEKGERKFYREKKVPAKKKKNYPTKPKHSWHKRLPKISTELGDLHTHTEWFHVRDPLFF